MGKKLSKAPVYYTIAQAQFNPILDLEAYIPAIQARMREMQFPDFKQEIIQRLILPFGGVEAGQMAAPTLSPQSRYQFGDIEGRSLFLLDTNTLSFQTTAYDTFEVFSKDVLNGLAIIHEALRLDFIERIGVRYLDAILPYKAGDTLREYLVPEVLAFSFRDVGQLQHSISETVTATPSGQLTSRVVIRNGHVGLPADLTALAPSIDPRFTQQPETLHAIIDTDASFTSREPFDVAKVAKLLSSLHEEINLSFKATVTPYALNEWA